MYTYIYIYIERERERCIHICMYIIIVSSVYYVTLYSAEAPERGASRAGALRGHLNKEKLVN